LYQQTETFKVVAVLSVLHLFSAVRYVHVMFQHCYITLRCDFYFKESQIKVHITIQSTLN